MRTRAAILVELGRPLEVVDLDIPALKPGQVLVEIAYSGVCHTQLLEARGHRGEDRFLPHCLGHEGSGVVREIGTNVTKVRPGDWVILSWLKGSGADVPGTQYNWPSGSRGVNAGGVTTFSNLTVASENRLTVLTGGVPLDMAALLGCAVPTGVGAVLNTARPRPGQSIAIFGCGGVGLCAVAGALIAQCSPIIAIDIREHNLTLAKELGATHAIQADGNIEQQLRSIVPAGLDIAIEATGRPLVMRQALASVRPRGGAAVIIGNARSGETLELDPQQLNQGKRLLGTWGGDCVPDRDIPRFADLLLQGKLNLSSLVGFRRYAIDQINEALDDLQAGRCIRPLVELSRTFSPAVPNMPAMTQLSTC